MYRWMKDNLQTDSDFPTVFSEKARRSNTNTLESTWLPLGIFYVMLGDSQIRWKRSWYNIPCNGVGLFTDDPDRMPIESPVWRTAHQWGTYSPIFSPLYKWYFEYVRYSFNEWTTDKIRNWRHNCGVQGTGLLRMWWGNVLYEHILNELYFAVKMTVYWYKGKEMGYNSGGETVRYFYICLVLVCGNIFDKTI